MQISSFYEIYLHFRIMILLHCRTNNIKRINLGARDNTFVES